MDGDQTIAGLTLEQLEQDYRYRIFNQYLPFWDKGGYDSKSGGFMCELFDDGSVQNDEKHIWYQGRGIWVYSCLYNYLCREAKYLEIASRSADFLKNHFYLGDGKWRNAVNRTGKPLNSSVGQGSEKDIYGALFAAAGLIEFYKTTADKNDLTIALDSIKASVKLYESPSYGGITLQGVNSKGLRTQGHSFILVWILTNLLSFYDDAELRELQNEHVDHLINHFWNPEYGIVNEYLHHDYSRISGYDQVMSSGHSLEALWMVMHEAVRIKDMDLFEICKKRIRGIIEMTWDYVFEGMCTEDYRVFQNADNCPGPYPELKSMWAHTELLIATMSVFELTGETWAREWYERCRSYCHSAFDGKSHGIWIQAVDRTGKNKKRPGISIYRKDNFHQIRYLMMNLRSIERMIRVK